MSKRRINAPFMCNNRKESLDEEFFVSDDTVQQGGYVYEETDHDYCGDRNNRLRKLAHHKEME